jgi:hypothetical protein
VVTLLILARLPAVGVGAPVVILAARLGIGVVVPRTPIRTRDPAVAVLIEALEKPFPLRIARIVLLAGFAVFPIGLSAIGFVAILGGGGCAKKSEYQQSNDCESIHCISCVACRAPAGAPTKR